MCTTHWHVKAAHGGAKGMRAQGTVPVQLLFFVKHFLALLSLSLVVLIKKGINLVLLWALIKTRRLGALNWCKMDLRVVHNWLNATTYPITTIVFPNGLARKTSPRWGKSRGVVVIPLISEHCYCRNTPSLLFAITPVAPSAQHYLHCSLALAYASWETIRTWVWYTSRQGMCVCVCVCRSVFLEVAGHCETVCPPLAADWAGRGACL